MTLFVGGRLIVGGTILGQDSATQFYPWYSYLGERLRSFDVPAWSSAQFGGAPFAADPQSGWTYLPAMILFSVFPLAVAANAYLVGHIAVAGFATYAFARVLKISPLGAFAAAVAYELSGPVYSRSVCCPAQLQVTTWMPLLLLGAELALLKTTWRSRARWWVFTGFVVSQILASWLGQVGYYALLVLGAYMVYRTLIDPPVTPAGPFRTRLWTLVVSGAAILAIGFGLAAAGLIPRFAFNELSNVAGGVYGGNQSYAAVTGGWEADAHGLRDLSRSLYYPGGAILALALMSIVLVRRRHAIPFFLFLSTAAMVLASHAETPLHTLLYAVLPRFEELHSHFPERITLVTYLTPAILAGTTIDALATCSRRRRLQIASAVPLLVIVIAALRWSPESDIPWQALIAALLAIGLVGVVALGWSAGVVRVVPVALVGLVLIDLVIAGPRIMAVAPYGGFHRINLNDYFAESGAVRFLQEQQANGPVRFFGYDPAVRTERARTGANVLYRDQFALAEPSALIVNNRATVFGLQDIQGYNPVQVQRYVDYLNALNGQIQNYHDANILADGLISPLLDLLNARYLVLPATIPPDREDLISLVKVYPVVYQDDDVQIVERTTAYPRAWLVHNAQRVATDDVLPVLSSGTINPRETALLDVPVPALEQPTDATADQVALVRSQPEHISLRVTTAAPAMVVLSEVSYPDWHVYVDGKREDAYVVDGLFRGVTVPAGSHTVEWRYQSTALTQGLAVSGVTLLGIIVLLGWPFASNRFGARRRRQTRPERAPAVA